MDAHEYLDLTEHAVCYFYEGLDNCWKEYEQALQYWDISRIGKPPSEEEMKRVRRFVEQAGKYGSLKFSEGTLAGAIVQVAATGIRLFSTNTIIPDDCISIVLPTARLAIPFCIGKRMYGLPLGLIIYAARNQYAHWEEDPHSVTTNVFNQLSIAFWDNPLYDLAFDLGNPTITIYANEILLGGLNWTTYEKYRSEMEELLGLDKG
jgi:hypothetical protein